MKKGWKKRLSGIRTLLVYKVKKFVKLKASGPYKLLTFNLIMSLSDKTLALFFTRAVSLKTWDEVGNLEREIKPYNMLAKHFKEIYFFTYGDKQDLEYDKILAENIKIFPKKYNLSWPVYSLLLPFFYRKELKKADILKTNQIPGAWSAVFTKWLYRKKLVARCGYEWLFFAELNNKSFLRRFLIYLAEKLSYRSADKIILATKRDKKFVERKFGIYPEKITIIPNYIDTNLFRPIEVFKEARRICFVGKLEEQKNIFNLIQAVSGLDVKFVIFGNGSLREELEGCVKDLNVDAEFQGNVPNSQLPEELNKAEIFILPSMYEGNPKALLEAMSCGLPCIGTNVEGIREIIKHKENGYLCGTDAGSIRSAIKEVLENKELQQKIGAAARRTILENFSLEKNLEKEIGIYENTK